MVPQAQMRPRFVAGCGGPMALIRADVAFIHTRAAGQRLRLRANACRCSFFGSVLMWR